MLLGPAGTGKTFRCLRQARQELKRSPDGAPLVFLTPKQATYQIERELLADPDLSGFTRLKVAGFEALARLILAEAGPAHAAVLSDLGRVMMLRALLAQEHSQLRTFHASARMQGFAQQLSAVLSELHGVARHEPSTGFLVGQNLPCVARAGVVGDQRSLD